jgi:flagellar biosynthesis protein FlhA
VIAVGTGIIVTRSASDTNLSAEVLSQITSFPKTLLLVAAALGGLLFVSGTPVVPTLVLEAGLLSVAWIVRRLERARAAAKPPAGAAAGAGGGAAAEAGGGARPGDGDADPYAALSVEPVEVHVGSQWVPLVTQPGNPFMERIAAFRKLFAQESGMVLPRVRLKDSAKLPPTHYEILIEGVPCARGEARLDRLLAIHPTGDTRSIPGDVTRDPTYGLPALWIEPHQREAAVAARFTLVDAATVFMTHLTEVLRREAARLLTRAETDRLLARVRQAQPGLVEELVPTVLSVSDLQKVLQNLLREKVPIRNLEAILETLADAGRLSKDPEHLTELVRQRLGHAICQGLLGEATALQVLTLDPSIEAELLASVQAARSAEGAPLPFVVEPSFAEQMISRLAQQAERMMKHNLLPVLLCSPELRRHVRALSERVMPHLRVLSMSEIPRNVELKSWGVVAL